MTEGRRVKTGPATTNTRAPTPSKADALPNQPTTKEEAMHTKKSVALSAILTITTAACATAQVSGTDSAIAPSPTVTTATTAAATPSETELSIANDFVAFGKEWSDETFSRLRIADPVMLGLGPEIIRTVNATDLRDPAGWDLDVEHFRAIEGPFSAGRLLANAPEGYDVSIGEHPHCVGPPQAPPSQFASHARISIQPPGESFDTCLQWFTVDLFVGKSGLVEAITMDIWEP
jgi:hypothetical protein